MSAARYLDLQAVRKNFVKNSSLLGKEVPLLAKSLCLENTEWALLSLPVNLSSCANVAKSLEPSAIHLNSGTGFLINSYVILGP